MKSLSKIVQESVDVLNDESFCCSADYCHEDCHSDKKDLVIKCIISSQISLLEAELERKNGMIESNACYKEHKICTCNKFETALETYAYNQAIQEDITYLTEQIEEIKKLITK